jgi:hypothetical protein
MAKSILSLNMVSIGILFSDGNLDMSMEDLAGKVKSWQIQNKRFFGVTEDDFINALLMLLLSDLNFENDLNDFYKLTFREIIPKILHYNEVYFNDEGEHWLETVEYEDSDLNRFFGINRKAYEEKIQTKKAMQAFFENNISGFIDSNQVNDFLTGQGITEKLLLECSDAY